MLAPIINDIYTGPNEPLTLRQIPKLNYQPLWVVRPGCRGKWMIAWRKFVDPIDVTHLISPYDESYVEWELTRGTQFYRYPPKEETSCLE